MSKSNLTILIFIISFFGFIDISYAQTDYCGIKSICNSCNFTEQIGSCGFVTGLINSPTLRVCKPHQSCYQQYCAPTYADDSVCGPNSACGGETKCEYSGSCAESCGCVTNDDCGVRLNNGSYCNVCVSGTCQSANNPEPACSIGGSGSVGVVGGSQCPLDQVNDVLGGVIGSTNLTVVQGQSVPFYFNLQSQDGIQFVDIEYNGVSSATYSGNTSTSFGQSDGSVLMASQINTTINTDPGTYAFTVKVTNQNNSFCGLTLIYQVTVTAMTPTCSNSAPAVPVVYGDGTIDLYAYGVNAGYVNFPVWSVEGGTDDQRWYPGTNIGNGTWKTTVNLSNHRQNNPDYGNYFAPVFMYSGPGDSGTVAICDSADFTRERTPTPPPNPTNLSATPSTCGTGQINLSWNASSGATSYTVKRGASTIYNGSNLFVSEYNLTPSQNYSYTITASNSDGTSDTATVSTTAPSNCTAPDLATDNLSTSGTLTTGQTISFSGRVINQGNNSSVSSQTRLRIDLNNDGTYDTTLTNQTTGALSPNGSETENWNWTGVAGTHKFEVCADNTNTVSESDEGDNCAVSASFTVAPTPITVSITANPTSMQRPANQTRLSWTTTGTPTSCVASQNWSGSKNVNGFYEDITSLNTGSYIFMITCSKSGTANAVDSVSVVVSPANQYGLTVNKDGTGNGTITGTGINCGTDCSESFSSGTSVTLSQTPSSGSTFTGWGGSCSGTGSCTVIMSQARTVSASYSLNSNPPSTPTGFWAGPSTCGTGQINLSWNASSGATSYTVKRGASTIYNGSNLFVSEYNLTPSQNYSYTITASNSDGTSDTATVSTTAPSNCTAPDLATDNLSTSGTLTTGQTISFSGRVINQGNNSSVSSQTRLRIDLNNDGTYDTTLTNQTTGALSPNGSETENWNWTGVAGTHKFEVCADNTNTVSESDEGDNCAVSASFTVSNASIPNATVSLTADNTSLPNPNTGTFLRWNYTNATSCIIDPSIITFSTYPSSSYYVSTGALSNTRTYTLSCNPGSVSSSVTINVSSPSTNRLDVIRSGNGTVVDNTGGINCGSDCTENYSGSPTITLTATPTTGRVFTGWGGDCSGRGVCTVVVSSQKSVNAYFAIDPNFKEF